jgi:hypothetical protein
VHVFRLPSAPESKQPHLPYEEAMVTASLRVLEAHCGDRPIDESIVSAMLGEIYQGEVAARWEADYQTSAEMFTTAILDAVEPCESADLGTYQQFFEMFDGIEVLPKDLIDDYYRERDANGYVAASGYLVNISRKQYAEFRGYGLVLPARDLEGEYADHILVSYSREFGLDLDGARQAYRQGRQADDW